MANTSDVLFKAAETMSERGHYNPTRDGYPANFVGRGPEGQVCLWAAKNLAIQVITLTDSVITLNNLLRYLAQGIKKVDPEFDLECESIINWSDTRNSAEDAILALKYAAEFAQEDGQ